MKKIGKYLGGVFGTFGLITPLIVVSLLFVLIVSLERNDAFTALIHASLATFVVLAVIGGLALIAAIVLILLKGRSKVVGVLDLLIVIVFIIAVLMLILFCFQPGNGSFLSVMKWTVTAFVLLASAGLGVFRAFQLK